MIRFVFIIILFLFSILTHLTAQEGEVNTSANISIDIPQEPLDPKIENLSPAQNNAKQGLYLVENITYFVNGQTQTWALEHRYKIKEKTRFSSQEEMDNYFKRKEREIYDNKIFYRVSFSYTLEPISLKEFPNTKVYKVHLFIELQDSLTMLLIPPLPRISNDRVTVSTRFTDQNIGGSLMKLTLYNNISFDIDNTTHSLIPAWNIGGTLSEVFFPGYKEAWWFSLGYNYNTVIQNNPINSERILEYDFSDLNFGLGSSIYIAPYFNYYFGIFNYFRFGNHFYTDEENLQSSIRKQLGISSEGFGYSLRYSHSISYDKVFDSGSMRRGYDLWVGNFINYNFNTNNITSSFEWGGRYFQPFKKNKMELSFRYIGFWNITGTSYNLGYMRGIRSYNVSGFLGNYINTTFLFSVWRWDKLFEFKLGLFLDGGITQKRNANTYKIIPISWDDFDLGTGIEGRLNFDIIRSYGIYGRLGIDLKRLPRSGSEAMKFWGGKYDFTIGFGTFY